MKKWIACLVFLMLAGCAATQEDLNAVAREEVARLAKPSKPLSTFSNYELRPFVLGPEVASEAEKVEQADILEGIIKAKLSPVFSNWSSSGDPERSGTLIVQPELVRLRVVSGGARFFAGAFAGDSYVDLDLKLIDGDTEEVIANPRINRDADAMAGAWSIGQSDDNLLEYISYITHEYLASNY